MTFAAAVKMVPANQAYWTRREVAEFLGMFTGRGRPDVKRVAKLPIPWYKYTARSVLYDPRDVREFKAKARRGGLDHLLKKGAK